METKTKLTPEQIRKLIEKYPEIAEKVISDFLAFSLVHKKFTSNELKEIVNLQSNCKILPTLRK